MIELARVLLAEGPKRVAPFSHAVRAGDLLFVTGQMPTEPGDNTRVVPGGIEAETRQVIANLKAVLAGCGAAWERTAMARIYLTHFEADYAAMNAIWEARAFSSQAEALGDSENASEQQAGAVSPRLDKVKRLQLPARRPARAHHRRRHGPGARRAGGDGSRRRAVITRPPASSRPRGWSAHRCRA